MQQVTLPILCHFPETSRKNQVLQTTASDKPPEKVEGGVQNKAEKSFLYIWCVWWASSFSPFGLQKSNFEVTMEENSSDSLRKHISKSKHFWK